MPVANEGLYIGIPEPKNVMSTWWWRWHPGRGDNPRDTQKLPFFLWKVRFHLPRPFNPHKPGIETGVSNAKDRKNTCIYTYIYTYYIYICIYIYIYFIERERAMFMLFLLVGCVLLHGWGFPMAGRRWGHWSYQLNCREFDATCRPWFFISEKVMGATWRWKTYMKICMVFPCHVFPSEWGNLLLLMVVDWGSGILKSKKVFLLTTFIPAYSSEGGTGEESRNWKWYREPGGWHFWSCTWGILHSLGP